MLCIMVKVAWLATLMDGYCSSYVDGDEGWMLAWHHRHGYENGVCKSKIYL